MPPKKIKSRGGQSAGRESASRSKSTVSVPTSPSPKKDLMKTKGSVLLRQAQSTNKTQTPQRSTSRASAERLQTAKKSVSPVHRSSRSLQRTRTSVDADGQEEHRFSNVAEGGLEVSALAIAALPEEDMEVTRRSHTTHHSKGASSLERYPEEQMDKAAAGIEDPMMVRSVAPGLTPPQRTRQSVRGTRGTADVSPRASLFARTPTTAALHDPSPGTHSDTTPTTRSVRPPLSRPSALRSPSPAVSPRARSKGQRHAAPAEPQVTFFHHFESMRPIRIRVGVVPLPGLRSGRAGKRSRSGSPQGNSPLAKWLSREADTVRTGASDGHVQDGAVPRTPHTATAVPSFALDRQAALLSAHEVTYVERFLPPRRFYRTGDEATGATDASRGAGEEVVGWAGVFSGIPLVLPGAAPASSPNGASGHETERPGGLYKSVRSLLPAVLTGGPRSPPPADMEVDCAGSITVVLAPNTNPFQNLYLALHRHTMPHAPKPKPHQDTSEGSGSKRKVPASPPRPAIQNNASTRSRKPSPRTKPGVTIRPVQAQGKQANPPSCRVGTKKEHRHITASERLQRRRNAALRRRFARLKRLADAAPPARGSEGSDDATILLAAFQKLPHRVLGSLTQLK